MAKRKSGSIAIPFLLTFFIALLIIGGAGLYLYNYFEKSREKPLNEPIGQTAGIPTYDDSHTLLFILDTPDQKCKNTFLLMRSIPKEKRMLFVAIPSNSITLIDGQQYSLSQYYSEGGGAYASDFIANVFEIDAPKYMIFDKEAYYKLSDIMGGVSYEIDVDILGFENSNEQVLNGDKSLLLLTYPLFNGGEKQRASVVSSLISSMVNQADGARIADGLDRNFDIIIDMVNTNVSATDYKQKKNAIKFMFNYGENISRFRIATGTVTGDYFLIDETFPQEVKDEYFQEHSNQTN